jgi:hypothetical protein
MKPTKKQLEELVRYLASTPKEGEMCYGEPQTWDDQAHVYHKLMELVDKARAFYPEEAPSKPVELVVTVTSETDVSKVEELVGQKAKDHYPYGEGYDVIFSVDRRDVNKLRLKLDQSNVVQTFDFAQAD